MGIQFGRGKGVVKELRNDEDQADSVGAIITYKAGYNPKAMADFFSKLEKKYGNGGTQLLSDHPNPGNRQAAIQKEIRYWPRKNYLASTSPFAQAKASAASINTYSGHQIAQSPNQRTW